MIVVTYWLGRMPYCEMCQDYHPDAAPCVAERDTMRALRMAQQGAATMREPLRPA
jgi:hypothetical protein